MDHGITIKLKRLNDNIKKKKKNWCLELYTANWTLSCKSSLTCHSKIPTAVFKLLSSYDMCCSSWAIPPTSLHGLEFNTLLNIIYWLKVEQYHVCATIMGDGWKTVSSETFCHNIEFSMVLYFQSGLFSNET